MPSDPTGYNQSTVVTYPPEMTGPPGWNQKSYAAAVDKARQSCKTCQVVQPDLVPLGAAIIGGGCPEIYDRRNLRQNRPFPGDYYPSQGEGPVYIPAAGSPMVRIAQGSKSSDPLFNDYTKELFQTPYDRTENKVSMGVLENPWTGETSEVFMDQIPPPTTNKGYLDPDQLKQTNPKLVWAQGGIDPNAPLRSKTEICQNIPGSDYGPNVWGDQLYDPERRARIKERVSRDIWNNRTGDYSVEMSLNGEAPAGFVGLVPIMRQMPFLPPTQILDTKDWTGPAGSGSPEGQPVPGIVHVRRPDLSIYPRAPALAGAVDGTEARGVVSAVQNRPTWRGGVETTFPGFINADQALGGHVILDTTVRDTLKDLMEQQFPQVNAQAQGTGGYVVLDTNLRETLKRLMELGYRSANAQVEGAGGHVVLNRNLRATLKTLMEEGYKVIGANAEGTGGYVVTSTKLRDTLKNLMEQGFPALNAARDTLGGHVILDTTVRDTLKGLMQQQFPAVAANLQNTGEAIPFQGELEGTRRQYYSDQVFAPNVGNTIEGPYPEIPCTTSDQFRGVSETYRVVPSKVDAYGGGNPSTLHDVGHSERDTPREFVPARIMPNMTQDNGTYPSAPRMIPGITVSCKRPDDFENQLSVRPTYFGEQ